MGDYQGLIRPEHITIRQWNNFWAKVVKSEHGYVWTGAKVKGHGVVSLNDKTYYVHRLVFEWATGVIPDVIDHTCLVSYCVTLNHLENVTLATNTARISERGLHYNSLKTECKRGHPYSVMNTYYTKRGRVCMECDKIRHEKWLERRG